MFKLIPLFTILMLLIVGNHAYSNEKTEVKKLKVGDIEIAYFTLGSGDPLVLITGFKGTMAMWDPAFLEELAKQYTVIAFDNRGAGLSTDTEENKTTIQQMANDAVGLIRGLGYKKVNLLGWSMGTSIALQFVYDHPELLNTLILCAPNPGGKNQVSSPDVFKVLTSPTATKQDLIGIMFPQTVQGKQAAAEYISRRDKAIEAGLLPNDLIFSEQTIERQSSALKLRGADDHLAELLPTIKVPTLVAGGLDDEIDPPENTRYVASQIPFAWAAFFPRAGHGFTSQNHLEFSRLVHVFIETNTADHAK